MAEVAATPLHILQGATTTLSAQFYDGGVAADPGVTTVGIVDSAGDEVVASGMATAGATTNPRTYSLDGVADLDTLTVTWTSANFGTLVTTHEVVGALLFTLAEARAFDNGALASTSKYTTAAIEEARARVTDEFERICGVSFVPRYRVETLSGAGRVDAMLSRSFVTGIRSVEYRDAGDVAWTAYDADQLADVLFEPWGEIRRETLGTFVSGRRNIRVGYEHGYEAPPLDIKRAALLAVRYQLVESNYSDRTISTSGEFGTVQLWTPGLSGRGTAIHPLPEVDRILRLHDHNAPVVA